MLNDLRNAMDDFIESPLGEAMFICYVLVVIVYGYVAFLNSWWPFNKRRKRT